jgi:hypothetical protein
VTSYEVEARNLSGGAQQGFNGAARRDDEELCLGVAKGYRWWNLQTPPADPYCMTNPEYWRYVFTETNTPWKEPFRGANGQIWPVPGETDVEYVATCGAGESHSIPSDGCGCGFWAYWTPRDMPLFFSDTTLQGVIEGYGSVVYGTEGFRAEKCRIVALRLQMYPVTIEAQMYNETHRRKQRKAFWSVLPELFPGVRLYQSQDSLVIGEGFDEEGVKLYEERDPVLPF